MEPYKLYGPEFSFIQDLDCFLSEYDEGFVIPLQLGAHCFPQELMQRTPPLVCLPLCMHSHGLLQTLHHASAALIPHSISICDVCSRQARLRMCRKTAW